MPKKQEPKNTPENQAKFLAKLAEGLTVNGAAKAIGVNRKTVYRWAEQNAAFGKLWDDAVEAGTDELEDEARRRGTEGVRKLVLHQGRPVLVPKSGRYTDKGEPIGELEPLYEHRHSDTLLAMLLNGRRPEKFKYRAELTGKNGGPIETKDLGMLEAARRIAFVLAKGAGQKTDEGQ